MSMFKIPPATFVRHDGFALDKAQPKRSTPIPLREDHIVLLAIDALLSLRAAVKRYITRRRTRRILAALDDQQLRDIGIARSEINDRSQGRNGKN